MLPLNNCTNSFVVHFCAFQIPQCPPVGLFQFVPKVQVFALETLRVKFLRDVFFIRQYVVSADVNRAQEDDIKPRYRFNNWRNVIYFDGQAHGLQWVSDVVPKHTTTSVVVFCYHKWPHFIGFTDALNLQIVQWQACHCERLMALILAILGTQLKERS